MGTPCDTTNFKPEIKILPNFVMLGKVDCCGGIGNLLLDLKHGYM